VTVKVGALACFVFCAFAMNPKRALSSGGAMGAAKKAPTDAFPLARLKMPAGWTLADDNFVVRDFVPAGGAPAREAGADDDAPLRVAAFDFDGCLANTPLGGIDPTAWKMQFPEVPAALRELHAQNYRIVIVTNESIDRLIKEEPRRNGVLKKTGRLDGFMTEVGVPCLALIAFAKDAYRKPEVGAWTYVGAHHGREPDKAASFFVGDAAGRVRPKRDHSDSDLIFAQNVGVRFFTETAFFVDRERMPR
jgi:bifunctional polynucleotide phosphatase/kinase